MRALEVGEQDGHLLALAFEGAAGGDDPLGQVLRRVTLRGRRGAHPIVGRLGRGLKAATAFQAEATHGRIVVAAGRTARQLSRSAAIAEFRPRGAPHHRPSNAWLALLTYSRGRAGLIVGRGHRRFNTAAVVHDYGAPEVLVIGPV